MKKVIGRLVKILTNMINKIPKKIKKKKIFRIIDKFKI